MREILFRGKRKDNGEWVYGAYIVMHHNDKRTHLHHFIIPDNSDLSFGVKVEDILVEVIPETVGQYTGLKDKNGKQIFEGDIIKTKFFGKQVGDVVVADYDEFVVKFDTGAFYLVECKARRFSMAYIEEPCLGFEVVGNIHDNPGSTIKSEF